MYWATLAPSSQKDPHKRLPRPGGSPSPQIWYLDAPKTSPSLSRRPVASALPSPSPTHHEHKDGHTAPGKHQVVADLPKQQAREDPANHPEVGGGNQCDEEAEVWDWRQGRSTHPTYL